MLRDCDAKPNPLLLRLTTVRMGIRVGRNSTYDQTRRKPRSEKPTAQWGSIESILRHDSVPVLTYHRRVAIDCRLIQRENSPRKVNA